MDKRTKIDFKCIRWAIVTEHGSILDWTISYLRKSAIAAYCNEHKRVNNPIKWDSYRKKHKIRCVKIQVSYIQLN